VIGLVEAFLENDNFYFVYNFHGFAVDLAQVATTPTVRMTEPDLASICRSILRGLEYIHNQLEISHGNITRSNILLYENGGIKIG
jgi:serine/threonine protein kinase